MTIGSTNIIRVWNKMSKSAMGKCEVKCNSQLNSNRFSVNVSVLAVVFQQLIITVQKFQWSDWSNGAQLNR